MPIWRRDGDLNSGGKIPHDFQSCAIPGYATSAYESARAPMMFEAVDCLNRFTQRLNQDSGSPCYRHCGLGV